MYFGTCAKKDIIENCFYTECKTLIPENVLDHGNTGIFETKTK